MRIRCSIALTLVLLGLCLSAIAEENATMGAEQDSLSALIEALARKGILTADEAEDLKGRIEEREGASAVPGEALSPPKPGKPKYPTVKTKVRLETRFSTVQEDDGQPYFGSRDDRTGGDGFAVRRARLYVMGDLRPETGYKVQYQSDWGHTNPNLHVAQMEWRGWDFADLILGQLQTTFGFEIAHSDAYLLCTDRAAVSSFLPPDKDIGIMLKSKRPVIGDIGYDLFVGNGSGKYLSNPDHGYLWIARLRSNPTPQLAVGAAVSSNRDTDFSPYQSRFLKKNDDPYGLLGAYAAAAADETSWEVDFQWSNDSTSVWGEYIKTKIEPGDGSTVTADGFYLYLHQFLPFRGRRDKLEAVLGYQEFDPNREATDIFDLTAYTVGLNYHLKGGRHGKDRCQEMLRFNYVWNREGANEVDNDKLIAQYQLWF